MRPTRWLFALLLVGCSTPAAPPPATPSNVTAPAAEACLRPGLYKLKPAPTTDWHDGPNGGSCIAWEPGYEPTIRIARRGDAVAIHEWDGEQRDGHAEVTPQGACQAKVTLTDFADGFSLEGSVTFAGDRLDIQVRRAHLAYVTTAGDDGDLAVECEALDAVYTGTRVGD